MQYGWKLKNEIRKEGSPILINQHLIYVMGLCRLEIIYGFKILMSTEFLFPTLYEDIFMILMMEVKGISSQ